MIIIASYSNVSVTYTADGTQTVFSFPFDYLRKAFVKVEVNEEIILVQGTDYSVSDNKTVVLTEAPESGTIVRIFRETSTTRLVSWADASVLRAKDMTIQQVQNLHILEEQQYWVTENAIIRDGREWNARNFPIKNVGDPVDPKDATNKEYVDDNFMKMDDNGDYWVGRGKIIRDIEEPIRQSDGATKNYVDHVLAGLSITGDRVQTFNSVALMKEAHLEPGMVAMTTGYHNPNDGGNGFYYIRAKEVGAVDDGGSIIFLDNDNEAKLITDGTVSVEQFGAHGDNAVHLNGNVDVEAKAIQTAIDFADRVLMPKTYNISQTINIPKTMQLYISGKLIYTGNDVCLDYADQTECHTVINDMEAENGTGIRLVSINAMSYENVFHINRLKAKVCIEEYGTNNHGVQYNTFYINKIIATDKCYYAHIEEGTNSWTGEAHIFGGHLQGASAHGIYSELSTGIRVFGTGFERLGHAFYLKNSENVKISGCRFERITEIESPKYGYKFVGNVRNCYVSGFSFYIRDIDISELTSTTHGSIVFEGNAFAGNGFVGGRRLIISDALIPYYEGADNAVVKAGVKNGSFVQLAAGGTIGDAQSTDVDAMNPTLIRATGSFTLGDKYQAGMCDDFYVCFTKPNLSVSDSDGTVMLTTTDNISIYHVRAMGISIYGATAGKHNLLFEKVYPV